MEAWKVVWRKAIVPLLPRLGLEALANALLMDDPQLLQGATTSPPPLSCVQDWPVEAACVVGYCGWKAGGLETVAQVEEFFAKVCFDCDQLMNQPAACRDFLNWFDETPRDEVRRQLLPEVERALRFVDLHEQYLNTCSGEQTFPEFLKKSKISLDSLLPA